MIVNPPPIPGLRPAAQSALDELRAGPEAIRAPLLHYRTTVDEQSLAMSHDPDLTEQGRANRMRQIREQAGQQAGAELETVRAALDDAHAVVRRSLERRWPSPETGVEAMLNRQAAWARSRSLLESGVSAAALLAETTEMETLFALREELPTWGRANIDRGRPASTLTVDRRIAELTGDFATAGIEAMCQAGAARAYCEPLLKHAAAEVTGIADRNAALRAAVEANAARDRAAADWS